MGGAGTGQRGWLSVLQRKGDNLTSRQEVTGESRAVRQESASEGLQLEQTGLQTHIRWKPSSNVFRRSQRAGLY